MADISIGEITDFGETLNDNTIIHTQEQGIDKRSTFSRVFAWFVSKFTPVTSIGSNSIVLADTLGNLSTIGIDDFLRSSIGGLLNVMAPVDKDVLISQGFTIVEIRIWELMKLGASPFPLNAHIEYVFAQNELDRLLASNLLEETGFWYVDGQNGTPDMRGCVARVNDQGAGRDTG